MLACCRRLDPLEQSHLGRQVFFIKSLITRPPPGSIIFTIRPIYFLQLLLFNCNMKARQNSYILIWSPPFPKILNRVFYEWFSFLKYFSLLVRGSVLYWRTEPPVFSISLKKEKKKKRRQSKALRINHLQKRGRIAGEKDWKSTLTCINILTFKWMQEISHWSSSVNLVGYTQILSFANHPP